MSVSSDQTLIMNRPASNGLSISIFTTNPPSIYSGGRYLSLMLAYSLASIGTRVKYVTDRMPIFSGDFEVYDQHYEVEKIQSLAFNPAAGGTDDWVIVIPTGSFKSEMYCAALDYARKSQARIALLSFETPNWFNTVSPFQKGPAYWEQWRRIVAAGGLVITIAREGIKYAKAFYNASSRPGQTHYGFWHPAINDAAADAAAAAHDGSKASNRILCFIRTEDPHKAAADLLNLDPQNLDGHCLSLIFGRTVDEDYVARLRQHFSQLRNFELDIHERITDNEKFQLLADTKVLLFPTYFEGFGYPPVEAAYMNVPSIVYDLPVLRETLGEAPLYVPPGDIRALNDAVQTMLRTGPSTSPRASLRARVRLREAGEAAADLLQRSSKLTRPHGQALPYAPTTPLGPWPAAARDRAVARELLTEGRGHETIINDCKLDAGGHLSVRGRIIGVGSIQSLNLKIGDQSVGGAILEERGAETIFSYSGYVFGVGADVHSVVLTIFSHGMQVGRKCVPLALSAAAAMDMRVVGGDTSERHPPIAATKHFSRLAFYLDSSAILEDGTLCAAVAEFVQQRRERGAIIFLYAAVNGHSAKDAIEVDAKRPLFDAVFDLDNVVESLQTSCRVLSNEDILVVEDRHLTSIENLEELCVEDGPASGLRLIRSTTARCRAEIGAESLVHDVIPRSRERANPMSERNRYVPPKIKLGQLISARADDEDTVIGFVSGWLRSSTGAATILAKGGIFAFQVDRHKDQLINLEALFTIDSGDRDIRIQVEVDQQTIAICDLPRKGKTLCSGMWTVKPEDWTADDTHTLRFQVASRNPIDRQASAWAPLTADLECFAFFAAPPTTTIDESPSKNIVQHECFNSPRIPDEDARSLITTTVYYLRGALRRLSQPLVTLDRLMKLTVKFMPNSLKDVLRKSA